MDNIIRKDRRSGKRIKSLAVPVLIFFIASFVLAPGLATADPGSISQDDLNSRITLSGGIASVENNIPVKDRNLRRLKTEVGSGLAPSHQLQTLNEIGNSIVQMRESRNQSRGGDSAKSQAKNIRRLFDDAEARGGFNAQFNKENGTPRFIKGPALTPKLQKNISDLALSREVTQDFLSKNAALFKLDDPAKELAVSRQNIDNLGQKHFHFQQEYKDVPVWGRQLSVHLDANDSIYFVNGSQIPTPKGFNTNPQISGDRAIDVTKQHLDIVGPVQLNPAFGGKGIKAPKAELVIYPSADGLMRLAYKVDILPKLDERWIYFIDAQTGEYIHRIYNIHHAPVTASGTDLNGANRSFGAWNETGAYYVTDPTIPTADPPYDPLNQNNPSGDTYILDVRNGDGSNLFFITNSTLNGGWDPAGVSAAYNTRQVYDYYFNTHSRNSIDGNGMNLMIAIHFASNYNNAFWNGTWMVYGDGDNQLFSNLAGALDVAAHEMTHGVIENTAGLIYENQSGALNESFADVFGAMVDRDDWLMGEDITVASPGHLRDMANPANGLNAQPGHMDDYQNLPNTEDGDNGGVHVNNGIPNRAAYLIAEGLTTEGLGTSIGRANTELIYYRALTTYLQASSDFLDAREAVRQAAEDLYGAGGAEEAAVIAAFGAVGIGSADLCSSTGGGAETPTDPVTGDDIMVYIWPNDGTYTPNSDECYSLWAYSRIPESSYDSNFDILLNDSSDPFTTNTAICNSIISGIFPESTRPTVYSGASGTEVYYVGTDQNIYAVFVDGTGHAQITTSGNIWSIALSPDGRYFAFTSTSASDNHVYIVDLVGTNDLTVPLVPPDYQNGGTGATNTIFFADSLAFDYSGTRLVFDALNCVSTPNTGPCDLSTGAGYQFWSIGFIDIDNATVSYPIPNQNPIFDVGYPAFAYNNSFIVALDILDWSDYDTNATVAEGVYILNRETQDLMPVASPDESTVWEGVWGAPTFWGKDDFVNMLVFEEVSSVTHGYPYRVPIDSTWAGNPTAAEQVFPFDTVFPVIHVAAQRNLTATLDVSTTSLDFGEAEINTTIERSLSLTNSGNRDIDISNMLISGSSAFSQNCSNALLARGSTMSITLRFTPRAVGTENATFTIESDADTPSIGISLAGVSSPGGEPPPVVDEGGGGGGGGCFIATMANDN